MNNRNAETAECRHDIGFQILSFSRWKQFGVDCGRCSEILRGLIVKPIAAGGGRLCQPEAEFEARLSSGNWDLYSAYFGACYFKWFGTV